MEARLAPLNAVLALLRGDGGWPAPLRDQGLACERLELPVTTSRSLVRVDLLSFTHPCTVIVPVEAKSGANVESEQLEKYLAMTPDDVERLVTLPGRTSKTSIQPLIACLEEHESRIRQGLASLDAADQGVPGNEQVSLLTVSTDRVRLLVPSSGALAPFEVEVPGPPPRIVPFDAQSPNDVIREPLVASVVASMDAGRERPAVADLLAATIPYWSVYGRAARNALSRRASQVLKNAAMGEFKGYFDVVKGGSEHDSDIVRILKSPIGYKPQGQTQGWQAVRRAAHRYLRKSPAPQIPGQGTFDALLEEAERSEDE